MDPKDTAENTREKTAGKLRVLITGATGFIGSALSTHLLEKGHEVVALTRDPERALRVLGSNIEILSWDAKSPTGWDEAVEVTHAIVNLAGENVTSHRWTSTRKRALLQSRLDIGRAVVEATRKAFKRPAAVLQASGVCYYGARVDEPVTESRSCGNGVLAELAKQWEASTAEVETLGVRHVVLRLGAVLGAHGGPFPRRARPFRFFAGGPIGNGRQFYPWIHLDDTVAAIVHLIQRTDLRGPFNLVAPEASTMKMFCTELGRAMHRPSWIRIPAAIPRTVFGDMVDEVLLCGQNARPQRLLDSGFRFRYPELRSALSSLVGKDHTARTT